MLAVALLAESAATPAFAIWPFTKRDKVEEAVSAGFSERALGALKKQLDEAFAVFQDEIEEHIKTAASYNLSLFVERMLEAAQNLKVGISTDTDAHYGPVVSAAHKAKVEDYIRMGVEEGAELKLDGRGHTLQGHENGFFVGPSLFDHVKPEMKSYKEEIFGPVLSVMTVDSFDEAIALANDTDYGLAASIFTANYKRAIRGARMLRAGTVTVNSFGEGDISTPFGGYKQSGFGGRDNGIQAHDQYTQIKTIWLDLADDDDEAVD
mgnify:CR=1 FL=1